MTYTSLEHSIRNIMEKREFKNPARRVGKAGGDWEEASEDQRSSKARELVVKSNPEGHPGIKEAIGASGTDKPVGTQFDQHKKIHIAPQGNPKRRNTGAESEAGRRVKEKEQKAAPLSMEEKVPVPNEGNTLSMADKSARGVAYAESSKKKIREEKSREDVEYVGRKDSDPTTNKSKLGRQSAIKTRIIDEAKKRADTIKKVVKPGESNEKTQVVFDPPVKTVKPDDQANF